MMVRSRIGGLIFLSTAMCSTFAYAGSGYRSAVIHELQSASSTMPNPNVMYVAQTGAWSGNVSCSTGWAYFNAKDNPHFAATVLAAQASGKAVRVYVDDSLPKIDGYCQVTYLSSFAE